jgi:hypothetical protein
MISRWILRIGRFGNDKHFFEDLEIHVWGDRHLLEDTGVLANDFGNAPHAKPFGKDTVQAGGNHNVPTLISCFRRT